MIYDERKRYEEYALHTQQFAELSAKEIALLRLPSYSSEQAIEVIKKLSVMGFVRCDGGLRTMGQSKGLRCDIEGYRRNEMPIRTLDTPPFYIAKTTVSNKNYDKFDARHTRTYTSRGDNHPATCITYGRAISYVTWLNNQTGLNFSLPTEPQIYLATAPERWEYSYQESGKPDRSKSNTFKSFMDLYPEGEQGATLEVDDPIVPTNHLGLHHMGGNVSVFTFGHYVTEGHWGALSDGAYNVIVGGNFRTCPYGARVVTRGVADVAATFDTVGIRLVHPDPLSCMVEQENE